MRANARASAARSQFPTIASTRWAVAGCDSKFKVDRLIIYLNTRAPLPVHWVLTPNHRLSLPCLVAERIAPVNRGYACSIVPAFGITARTANVCKLYAKFDDAQCSR